MKMDINTLYCQKYSIPYKMRYKKKEENGTTVVFQF